jgi:hypothetical protein
MCFTFSSSERDLFLATALGVNLWIDVGCSDLLL